MGQLHMLYESYSHRQCTCNNRQASKDGHGNTTQLIKNIGSGQARTKMGFGDTKIYIDRPTEFRVGCEACEGSDIVTSLWIWYSLKNHLLIPCVVYCANVRSIGGLQFRAIVGIEPSPEHYDINHIL